MAENSKISLRAQIEEVDYELSQRKSVYSRLNASNPSRASERDMHVARMKAVRATLVWLQENEEPVRAALAQAEEKS